jgi:SAM-dependent methyltransferase
MNPECHICNTESKFLLKKDGFDLYKCPKCELVFVYPQPSPEILAKDFYSEESGYQSNRARQDLSIEKEQSRVKFCFDFFEAQKKRGSILDVGCGSGQMMYWAQKRGFESSGVELNKRTADRAKEYGLNVYNGFLENAPFPKNSFDFIFLGEIIEHVNNPRNMIKLCSEFLKSDGLIAITTPNIDCFWSKTTFWLYKVFKIPWSSVTPPYHLFQFGPMNLDNFMKSEGFEFVKGEFLRIPPLKYELGMLHLLKKYKQSRKIKDLVFALFSFGIYTIVHTIFKMLHPLLNKDFEMVRIYEK